MISSDRIERALRHIREFASRAAELIMGITPEDLVEEGGLNPYMVASLGINNIRDAVELFVYRRVERSLGTSFGNAIEAFLRDLLGGISGKDHRECKRQRGKSWMCWWDVVVEGEYVETAKRYKGIVLAVRSGPADFNKDIVERFVQHAREAEQNGYRPYLVLTYGKRAFGVAESTLRSKGLDPQNYMLVGREVFRRLLGQDLYDDVVEKIFSASKGLDIFGLMEKKVEELTAQLRDRYGDDIRKLLKDLS
ncbi:hypothetical protein [Pyrobaculum sp.]|uniref:hypothetical protein n=1 Tax=Pyrobaculum sp. TaxID=2004705 RepID=UPI0031616924